MALRAIYEYENGTASQSSFRRRPESRGGVGDFATTPQLRDPGFPLSRE
jgi:hypothetical protein